MAIKISSITKSVVDKGQHEWKVCTLIKLGSWLGYKPETALDKIVNLGLKLIAIEWDFAANGDIITVINGLNSAGYKIIFFTDSGDEVWPMIRFKWITLSIEISIPIEWELVNYLPHITTYFREKDEMRFKIKEKKDYDKFREFQKTKNISLPIKILEVDTEYKTAFENMIYSDVANMEKLIIKYI